MPSIELVTDLVANYVSPLHSLFTWPLYLKGTLCFTNAHISEDLLESMLLSSTNIILNYF